MERAVHVDASSPYLSSAGAGFAFSPFAERHRRSAGGAQVLSTKSTTYGGLGGRRSHTVQRCDCQVPGSPHVPRSNHRLRQGARPESETPRSIDASRGTRPPSRPSSQPRALWGVPVVRIRGVTRTEIPTGFREVAEGTDPNQPRSLVARGFALVRHVTRPPTLKGVGSRPT